MSTPGQGSILGSSIIYAKVDYGPTFGQVYRPVTQSRTFTGAGDDTIQPYDQNVRYKKVVPATFSVFLPDTTLWMRMPYGGFPLLLKDGAYNASIFNIMVQPFGTQTVDGILSVAAGGTGYSIAADGASLLLRPLTDLSGWEVW